MSERDLVIKLVRHGESEHNTGRMSTLDVGDYAIPLSPRGREQALAVGRSIGRAFVEGSLAYTSPYKRTRETLSAIFESCGLDLPGGRGLYEDPRLREVEHGYEDVAALEALRKTHGWFYYRFRGGESPADCYDRTSSFLESMMRQVERKQSERVLIVTHGLAIRCFAMRFMHLTVEQFDALANPGNCDVVTIAAKSRLDSPVFVSGHWGVTGLRTREDEP